VELPGRGLRLSCSLIWRDQLTGRGLTVGRLRNRQWLSRGHNKKLSWCWQTRATRL